MTSSPLSPSSPPAESLDTTPNVTSYTDGSKSPSWKQIHMFTAAYLVVPVVKLWVLTMPRRLTLINGQTRGTLGFMDTLSGIGLIAIEKLIKSLLLLLQRHRLTSPSHLPPRHQKTILDFISWTLSLSWTTPVSFTWREMEPRCISFHHLILLVHQTRGHLVPLSH